MDQATQSTVFIIVAIGGQLIAIIAAIFAGWSSLSTRRIASETKTETLAQTVKIDTVVKETAKIEPIAKDTAVVLGHVNSEKAIAEGRENTLKAEKALLSQMLTDNKQTAALLAQAASHPLASSESTNTVDMLGKIESNTAATAEGVQELKK